MADLQPPSPIKKKLPFKRTARRKSSEVPDDGLALFSRSGSFFEEQQRRVKEKEERAARAAKAEQERKNREARDRKVALGKPPSRNRETERKRRRSSLSDEEKDDDSDDIFGYKPSKKQKSPSAPRTPTSKRESSFATSTRGSGGRSTRSQSRNTGAAVISLDDEDEDPIALDSPSKRPRTRNFSKLQSPPKSLTDRPKRDIVSLDDDSDFDIKITEEKKDEDGEEDPSEFYVRAAMERARKAKEEREAREKAGDTGSSPEDDPVVSILIHSRLHGIHPLLFRRKISQKLTVVYQTWIEQQVAKHSLVPRPILENMFFTWKGNKVYQHTALQTLGIKPDSDGGLYPSWKSGQEGYDGRDKVLFEAWTQELYEEYLEEKEKQRLRDLGELVDEKPEQKRESEQPEASQEEKKIRIHFKAKDRTATKATVRSSTTAAQMIKVYRRLADIPEGKTIELHWDGEVLEPDTTVEEADIDDMDSLEVHIK
ncbi:hypothetical protein M426DRAFT_319355 [Hypoxylon sp. CI-4A]|nr:hypothetical protein M426DRAFT_319355 [Hypoxylon sp. CI-4A]